ncbi:MAG: transglutaminase domain-containing protein [Eubacteriales bacterium]|nr:transglutaminase domain-containing protein [Eubacteriales bacterium]
MKRWITILLLALLLAGVGMAAERLPLWPGTGIRQSADRTSEPLEDFQSYRERTSGEAEADPEEPEDPAPSDGGTSAMDSVSGALLSEDMSDYEKVKTIHDHLVVTVDYDYEGLASGSLPDSVYTAEGALIHHLAVCEGYARAFGWLCDQAGLENLLVFGTADDGTGVQSHAWNQVRVDGVWYNVDVTWDDPLVNGQVVTDGSNLSYAYFLVPDSTLSGTHTAENPEELHACTDSRYLEENRRLTIEPYLQEPCRFLSSDQETADAIRSCLSSGSFSFQLVFDAGEEQAEQKLTLVLNEAQSVMQELSLYGQISAQVQYGIAGYAVVSVTVSAD